MRDQEIIGLYEAYASIYAPKEDEVVEEVEQLDEDANYDRNRRRAAQRAAARNEARKQGKTGSVSGVGYVTSRPERETYRDSDGVERHTSGARMPKKEDQKEEVDLFDYILKYLVAEGYADTNENALVIMTNMSEEWRQSITENYLQELTVLGPTGAPVYSNNPTSKAREEQKSKQTPPTATPTPKSKTPMK